MSLDNLHEKPLVIFEMANNHGGSLAHGLKIVAEFSEIVARFPFQFAFKFQFRDLDTFIHPTFQHRSDLKYVKRFQETRLSREDFRALKKSIDGRFLSICTPFDEPSVDLIEEMKFSVIKIASCSFNDWPLLERVARCPLPVIASTAGVSLRDMDRVVSFFRHRKKQFALMHCVGEYPTAATALQLNQIDLLRARYPEVPIGFSSHEDPSHLEAVPLAVAKGAQLFEKHVAIDSKEFPPNAYSVTPPQMVRWLAATQRAFEICGVAGKRNLFSEAEAGGLRQLKRGVFTNRAIRQGEKIGLENVSLAFPSAPGQLLANDMSKYSEFHANEDLPAGAPVLSTTLTETNERARVYEILQRVKQLLQNGNVVVPGMAEVELSHHYGIDRFEEIGCTLITVINREYCKKLIVVFPGQAHPEHLHKVKEESFLILFGEVKLSLHGQANLYKRGDVITINRGTPHSFSSETGAIIEEISSTHYSDDSYYIDPAVALNPRRKSELTYWMDVE